MSVWLFHGSRIVILSNYYGHTFTRLLCSVREEATAWVIRNAPEVMLILKGVRKVAWRRKWQPAPVFLPEKSHGQRSLVGYSPWGRERNEHELAARQQQR